MSNKGPSDKKRKKGYMRFFHESDRLESFENWPFRDTANCSRKKVAEAGFIWTGTTDEFDKAQCFLCFKSLGDWKATDCPWAEHLKHSPNCRFAQLKRPEALLSTKERDEIKAILKINYSRYTSGADSFPIVETIVISDKKESDKNKTVVVQRETVNSVEPDDNKTTASSEPIDIVDAEQLNNNRSCNQVIGSHCTNCEKNTKTIKACEEKIADLMEMVLKTNKVVNRHTIALNGASDVIKEQMSKTLKPFKDHNVMVTEFIHMVNDCMVDIDEKIKYSDMMISDIVESLNRDPKSDQMKDNIQAMNMQIHRLSAYIVQHERRMNEVQRELAKLLYNSGKYGLKCPIDSNISHFFTETETHSPINKSPIGDEVLNSFFGEFYGDLRPFDGNKRSIHVEPATEPVKNDNKQKDTNITTIFCYLRKKKLSEYELYQEFSKFGEVTKLVKINKQRYGFLTFKSNPEASKAMEGYNKDLFDCRWQNNNSEPNAVIDTKDTEEQSEVIVKAVFCQLKNTNETMNNIQLFRYFGHYGEVENIYIIPHRKAAIIKFDKPESAQAAIEATHSQYTCNLKIERNAHSVVVNGETEERQKNRQQRSIQKHESILNNAGNNAPANNNRRKMHSSSHRQFQYRDTNKNSPQRRPTVQSNEAINAKLFVMAGYGDQRKQSLGNRLFNTRTEKQGKHPSSSQRRFYPEELPKQRPEKQGSNRSPSKIERNDRYTARTSGYGNCVIYCKTYKRVYEDEVYEHFVRFGKINRIQFINNANYFFVYFSNPREARDAAECSHHELLNEINISCYLAGNEYRSELKPNEVHDESMSNYKNFFRRGNPQRGRP